MHVLAGTAPSAVNEAKAKLGSKIKKQHLHHFVAVRVKTTAGLARQYRKRFSGSK